MRGVTDAKGPGDVESSLVKPSRFYAPLARAWASVFAVVGLVFLLRPRLVVVAVDAVARAAGGHGTIDVEGGPLWWVLALSLMSVLTLLALASARAPADPLPYRALLTSKLVSTAGFAALAAGGVPAWWVCAASDGFVALTLWAARRADGLGDAAPEPVR